MSAVNYPITSLAVFRILFGGVMCVSILRFMLKGWVDSLYVQPIYHFTYYGFEWVKPLGAIGMYALFISMALSAFSIMLGLFYRLSIIFFFVCFTYVELIDKSNYLNHYYFVSLISFLLIFIPAHRYFSLDTLKKPQLAVSYVPSWTVNILKVQIAIVYIFSGIAKFNPDWIFHALPLKIWLPAKADTPLIGDWLLYEQTAYIFSWAGALYDLFIVAFLCYAPTRIFAYGTVIIFHLLTAVLFQIGMFPYIMILITLIFFSSNFHQNLIHRIKHTTQYFLRLQNNAVHTRQKCCKPKKHQKSLYVALCFYLVLQTLLPFRYILYPGKLFWTEQGYRFSWRVMLIEKAGQAFFYVKNTDTDTVEEVRNSDYLTAHQEQMMATQPDMILQFAHFLKEVYQKKGINNIVITTKCYVTLNGMPSRLFINTSTDLLKEKENFYHKSWILPYE